MRATTALRALLTGDAVIAAEREAGVGTADYLELDRRYRA